MIFLTKVGKPSHTNDYRPISLSSSLLKTLKRGLAVHIRASIDMRKSVEIALYYLSGGNVHARYELHFSHFTGYCRCIQ